MFNWKGIKGLKKANDKQAGSHDNLRYIGANLNGEISLPGLGLQSWMGGLLAILRPFQQ